MSGRENYGWEKERGRGERNTERDRSGIERKIGRDRNGRERERETCRGERKRERDRERKHYKSSWNSFLSCFALQNGVKHDRHCAMIHCHASIWLPIVIYIIIVKIFIN